MGPLANPAAGRVVVLCSGWFQDAVNHLGLKETPGVFEYSAEYGMIPDMKQANPKHDCLFTFNGTTSGARIPDGTCGAHGLPIVAKQPMPG
jgi:phosphoserine aminotransferase